MSLARAVRCNPYARVKIKNLVDRLARVNTTASRTKTAFLTAGVNSVHGRQMIRS